MPLELGERPLEGGERAGASPPPRPGEAAAAGGGGAAHGLASRRACGLVGLEVCPGPVDLADRDQRLDRVGPDGEHRVVYPDREETPGQVAE